MFAESAGIKKFAMDFIVIEASPSYKLIHFYLGIYSLVILGYFSLISELQTILEFSVILGTLLLHCVCVYSMKAGFYSRIVNVIESCW